MAQANLPQILETSLSLTFCLASTRIPLWYGTDWHSAASFDAKVCGWCCVAIECPLPMNYSPSLLQVAGEILQPPRPLPWYSNKLAWHLSFSRGQLRKLPILAEIHELLKRENEAGSITRQEAVSMVPPLFLGVEPHHRVSPACHRAL